MQINKTLKAALLILLIFSISAVFIFNWTVKQSKPTTLYENSTDIEFAAKGDFNNCIVLKKGRAVLIISDKTTPLNYSNLKIDLSNKIDTIKEQEIKIIMTQDSDYQDVVTVLKVMTDKKIKNYKLLKA